MTPAVSILLLWVLFIGTHLGLASVRVEPGLRKRLGERGFLGFYSLLALGAFVPLCWVYFGNRHAGEWLWHVPVGPVLRAILYAGMFVALLLIVAGVVRPSPASMTAGAAPKEPTEVRGAFRITRSPLVMGSALLMALHLVPNASTADVAFFGGFVVFAVAGAWHQDARKRAYETPGFEAFHRATGFWPFAHGGFAGLREVGVSVWLVTALAFLAIRWVHPLPLWPH